MALVVESTSTTSASNADSLTINKPTGTVEGDLLLLCASGNLTNYPTSSGFTSILSHSGNSTAAAILYKIATSSEPSTYTVDLTDSATSGAACMYRISGWTSGSPLYTSDVVNGSHDTASATLGDSGLSLLRPSANLLIQVWSHKGDNAVTLSNYSVTHSGSNPTWTEVIDTSFSISSSAFTASFGSAYANDSDTSTITAYNVDITSTTAGSDEGYVGLFLVIAEPQSASGTTALHAVTPSEFAEAVATAGTTGSNALLEPDVAINTTSGTEDSRTVWTNGSKNSTTWTQGSK